ncbi:hypothetical protein GCM10022205_33780 [Spinactinospora alkalitolerans]
MLGPTSRPYASARGGAPYLTVSISCVAAVRHDRGFIGPITTVLACRSIAFHRAFCDVDRVACDNWSDHFYADGWDSVKAPRCGSAQGGLPGWGTGPRRLPPR